MGFGVDGGFSADNYDVENEFEIVADLLEESDFQIEKENDLNNVSFIYVHKILFIASRCMNAQKPEYLENGKSFLDETKNIFHNI